MTERSRLAAAHRGYDYQDLLSACRLVDLILGGLVEVRCDEKLFDGDLFDDLTTIDLEGRRERTQFKYGDQSDVPLPGEAFRTGWRDLRLDRLLGSAIEDREMESAESGEVIFRVVLPYRLPTAAVLTAVLESAGAGAKPLLTGMETSQLRFRAGAIWDQNAEGLSNSHSFGSLFKDDGARSYEDLEWFCDRLVVEVGAPRASFDLSNPGPAEHLLLTRVRNEVGAEAFPNEDRDAVDVAAAFVDAARAARQRRFAPDAQGLLRRARLRSDFGAVSRSHPVESAVEVTRGQLVNDLVGHVDALAPEGGRLLIQGPPGQGKSWLCQQLLEELDRAGWLVGEHYCYLGEADGELLERVIAETVLGSLLGRMVDEDHRLVHGQRPRLAADEEALEAALRRSVQLEPNRRVALIVDGIDHVTRVRTQRGSSFDPSKSMAETLAAIDLPRGVVLVVLSQPGSHLSPLSDSGITTFEPPGLSRSEISELAVRFEVGELSEITGDPEMRSVDDAGTSSFVDALWEHSGGNALYATYLCRESLRSMENRVDPKSAILDLPPYDGSLRAYYDHLYRSLGDASGWIADVVAIADFPISRAELREIRPDAGHRVDRALEVLGPVLVERATQGGIRIYHESFGRYLRASVQDDQEWYEALLGHIIDWLSAKGLLDDGRAFKSLIPLLAEAGSDQRVISLAGSEFVADAVSAGFAASAINRNIATAVGAAARLGRWPEIVRFVEMSRAAETFQDERFDDKLVEYADVAAGVLGADTLAERLVDEDRTVMPARQGIQMCAALDALGAVVPWRPYVDAYLLESKDDNTHYGDSSDRAVDLAWLRGQLRLLGSGVGDKTTRTLHRPRTARSPARPKRSGGTGWAAGSVKEACRPARSSPPSWIPTGGPGSGRYSVLCRTPQIFRWRSQKLSRSAEHT
jgi:hypothetical protein